MHVHKLPDGFDSWMRFYDHVAEVHPDIINVNKASLTLYLPIYDATEVKHKKFVIRMDRLKMLCFDEINAKRLTMDESLQAFSSIDYQIKNNEIGDKLHKLLITLAKWD
jgi:hypothetical protein